MIRARALDVLLRAGVRLGRDPNGELIAIRVPAELGELVDELHIDLALAVAGARRLPWYTEEGKTTARSYAWRRCNACGRETMTRQERTCSQTPRCKGRVLTYHDPPPLELDGQPIPCARPGCTRPATHLTGISEAICASDFAHLALIHEHRRTHP